MIHYGAEELSDPCLIGVMLNSDSHETKQIPIPNPY